jgi:hypothetical protein
MLFPAIYSDLYASVKQPPPKLKKRNEKRGKKKETVRERLSRRSAETEGTKKARGGCRGPEFSA